MYFSRTIKNHTLQLLQQHGFIVEEFGCWICLPAVQIFRENLAHHYIKNTSKTTTNSSAGGNLYQVRIRDGSRFSNIRIFYLIIEYRLVLRLFSKGVPGLDNKDCPMAWRTLGFVTCQIGPLQVVTKLYHLHAFLSLVCCLFVFCSVWTARAPTAESRASYSVNANHAGEWNFWYVQPDCVNNGPVKQYIVRGPFVTASQTTQNNKPKLTKRCTPQSASLPPSPAVSH